MELLTDPRHVAIIMDGNGRWAERRGLPRSFGHRAGVEALRRVVRHSADLGIRYLTVYAFSTENWKRPRREVNFLFGLLREYFQKTVEELHAMRVRIRIIGDMAPFPADVRELAAQAGLRTRENDGLRLQIALNYGGRAEIVKAARALAEEARAGTFAAAEIDEDRFALYLHTAGLPDPELVIRTSGESRLSNFLLWQTAYAELVVTDLCWPDFDEAALENALTEYRRRDRRFGSVRRKK
ncbi:MAG: isoprenyl transferase [Gracilibacteraceae bacterium]|jgi:undecaprenyl diphosphate synthase|nr:isoprenyl transferase [Gracilibacteraceae bacterium]